MSHELGCLLVLSIRHAGQFGCLGQIFWAFPKIRVEYVLVAFIECLHHYPPYVAVLCRSEWVTKSGFSVLGARSWSNSSFASSSSFVFSKIVATFPIQSDCSTEVLSQAVAKVSCPLDLI